MAVTVSICPLQSCRPVWDNKSFSLSVVNPPENAVRNHAVCASICCGQCLQLFKCLKRDQAPAALDKNHVRAAIPPAKPPATQPSASVLWAAVQQLCARRRDATAPSPSQKR